MTTLEARFQQGLILHQQGKLADAERIYQKVLRQRPHHFDALHMLGAVALQSGRIERGVELIGKAVTLNTKNAAAYNNLGHGLAMLDRNEEAVANFDMAIRVKPDYANAHFNRGVALAALNRPEEAVASHAKVIALDPNHAEAHCNHGAGLAALNRLAEALASFDKAIALKPGYVDAWYNRGRAQQDLNRFDEAVANYDMAIRLKPDFAEVYVNRGVALRDLKRHAEAIRSYENAIDLKPEYAEAYWNLSLCLLQMGDFERGWSLHEWRKRKIEPRANRSYPQPLWLGEDDIDGKTLFLHAEQGFGDTIQFCRYAKLVEARGAKVIMEVPPRLRGLLEQISSTIVVTTPDQPPAAFDYHCPLMSLPLAFRTILATIPAEPCYVRANDTLRSRWPARLPSSKRPRVGVVWSGSSSHKNDRNRSLPLTMLRPLAGAEIDLVCLQKEVSQDEAVTLRQAGISFHGDEQNDFSDAAALIDLMDLVITVDTAVAHLAAAMGKPTWILLSHNPDWRWLLDREDSPWYPSVKLFRQSAPGDWAGVIDLIRSELNFWFGIK